MGGVYGLTASVIAAFKVNGGTYKLEVHICPPAPD